MCIRDSAAALEEEIQNLSAARKQAEDAARNLQAEKTKLDAAIQELNHLLESGESVDVQEQQRRSEELVRQRSEAAQAQKVVHARLVTNETALQKMEMCIRDRYILTEILRIMDQEQPDGVLLSLIHISI